MNNKTTTIKKATAFKILLVSENFHFRNTLASKLRLENFDVELATGGFHTFHLVEHEKDLNLIIINENMGDMPGHEIISIIRTMRDKNDLPILYISKNQNKDEILSLVTVGANEYIIRTTNYQSIIESVHKYAKQMKKNVA